jgi:hypothetical protein
MMLTSPRKILWLAVAGTGCLVILLVLLPATPQPRTLDFRIAGRPQVTNGVMLISFVLSNGTSRSLNILDDAAGKPFLVLDAGTGGNMPGTIGLGLGVFANTLKLNLAPGAALTNAVRLTNPPPRFRLLVEVPDLASERRRGVVGLLRFLAVKATLLKETRDDYRSIILPASPWIEDGSVSTMTQRTTERQAKTPTNGLSMLMDSMIREKLIGTWTDDASLSSRLEHKADGSFVAGNVAGTWWVEGGFMIGRFTNANGTVQVESNKVLSIGRHKLVILGARGGTNEFRYHKE